MADDIDLWEAHSAWWQDGFTEGPIPSTSSRSCRWPPTSWPGTPGSSTSAPVRARSPGCWWRAGPSSWPEWIPPPTRWTRRAGAGGPVYARSGADALPFPDAAFDAVVACLVFEHIEAVDGAIDEVARVLRPGGRFAFFLNHPLLQTPGSGWIDDQVLDPPEQYWRIGPYLVEDNSVEEVEKDVFIPFIHRPMSRYVNAMADAGLTLRRMLEPPPPPASWLGRRSTRPRPRSRLLVLVAERDAP
ncbi:MAG: methyltransferase domain-containing protein [Acidimicrobiales bacterium]